MDIVDKNNFNITQRLNEHCGCDFDKAYFDKDPVEIAKMQKHFDDETLRVRKECGLI